MSLTKFLSHKSTIWYILLFAFLLRLVSVLVTDSSVNDTVDGLDYHHHALSLLNSGEYPAHGSLPFMRPPLYPILLSIVYYFVPHDSYLTARLVNVVTDLLTCFVFYKLILLVWKNYPTAIISTFIYAVNPFYVFFSARVRVEALFILLVVSGIYILIAESKKENVSLSKIFLSGIIFGLACLCRSNGTALLILIPVWLIYWNYKNIRKTALIVVMFLIGGVLVIAPWSIRNYEKFGETILITDGFGYAFWISNSELKYEDLDARTYQEYIDADERLWKSLAVVEAQIKDQSIKERDNHYFNMGMDYIKNNPSRWVWLNVLKTAEFWSPMARLDMQGYKAFFYFTFRLINVSRLVFLYKKFFLETV